MQRLIQYLLAVSLVVSFFSGCAQSPTPEKVIVVDPSLPYITMNGIFTGAKWVMFKWQPVNDPRVVGYRVYRTVDTEDANRLMYYTSIVSPLATDFVDINLKPNTQYQYAFTTFTNTSSESTSNRIYHIATNNITNTE